MFRRVVADADMATAMDGVLNQREKLIIRKWYGLSPETQSYSLAEIGRTFVAHLDEDGDGDVSWAEVEAFGRRLLGRPAEP